MMPEIRGHESGHRVKMNEAIATRSARSASVTVRPDRSTSRNEPSGFAAVPEVLSRAGGVRSGSRRAPKAQIADETTIVRQDDPHADSE